MPRVTRRPLAVQDVAEIWEFIADNSFGRYVIFHVAQDDGVEVVRVLHCARDVGSDFAADDSSLGD